ncbi:hypothetical protein N7475_003606 [Penicillium sp. IBT 31633x]|nr:hypothetical protein N7475_003606 [Penicillium sp. IBT 31633x]
MKAALVGWHALGNGVEVMESGHYNNLTSLHTRGDEAAALEIGRSCGIVHPWKLELIMTTRRDTFAARGKATTPLCSPSEIDNRVISEPSTRWNESQETPDLHCR